MDNIFSDQKLLEPIKTVSLAEKVYNIIEKNITDRKLKPGSSLSEDEIAKSLNISRSPVREALIRLEQVGLVDKKSSGRVVAKISKKVVLDLYQVWQMTESYAGKLACENFSEDNLMKLTNIIKKMEKVDKKESIEEYRKLNYHFHLHLVDSCPNLQLIRIHKNILNRIQWCYNFSISLTSDIKSSSVYHHEILEAYKNKNCNNLEKLISNHINDARNRFKEEFEKMNQN